MKTRIQTLLFFTLLAITAGAKSIRLTICSDRFSASTKFFFAPGATVGFDRKSDKVMKSFSAKDINYIYSSDEKGRMIYTNYCPEPVACVSIPVTIFVQDSGTFNLQLEEFEGDLSETSFTLTALSDMKLLKLTPGLSELISFTAADLGTEKKFMLNVFPTPKIHTTPVSCIDAKNGAIVVDFKAGGEWKAKARNMYALVATIPALSENARIEQMAGGVYYVEGWKNNMKIWEELVHVRRPAGIRPKFTVSDDTLKTGQPLFTENYSEGGSHFYWEFGDTKTSGGYAPAHTYAEAGNYSVTLTVADAAGCTATQQKTVHVMSEWPEVAKGLYSK